MSIQSELNNAALEQLPKILNLIANADRFERDQIIDYTLRQLMQCNPCLDDMTLEQKSEFENNLIALFKEKGWV